VLIYQHYDERQREVAASVRNSRQEAAAMPEADTSDPDDQRSGTNLARDD
jgi:hypothetical protein